MRPATFRPKVHVHVCAHRRSADDPLGAGCSERGEAAYAALIAERARRGLQREVWVAKSHCLGQCPRTGCTAAIGTLHLVEVSPSDASALMDAALSTVDPP